MTPPLQYPKRLIEVDLPIQRISAHARREKSIRHGNISTLHVWWARRPLAACRAVTCAALWPDPADPLCPQSFRDAASRVLTEFARAVCGKGKIRTPNLMATCSPTSYERWEVIAEGKQVLGQTKQAHQLVLRFALLDFIADFANWDNAALPEYLETARALTQAAHEAMGGERDTKPLVVDPFAGGGAIPLEALRIGADAFASDLNPVAVLLNKVLLEYLPKYRQKLADEVRKWGQWIEEHAGKELGRFYPVAEDGSTAIAYIWARTILSEAPGRTNPIEVPLFRSGTLAQGRGGQALIWVETDTGKVKTRTAEAVYADGATRLVLRPQYEIGNPSKRRMPAAGTSKAGSATCPVTEFTTSVESVRKQLHQRSGGASDARLLCVVTTSPGASGRLYRLPTSSDFDAVVRAGERLKERIDKHKQPSFTVPDGAINHLRGFFNVVLYGIASWGDLFTPRQNLAHLTMIKLLRDAADHFQSTDHDLRIATQAVLALAIDRVATQNSSLSWWHPAGEFCVGTFGRQALPMVWDFCEINPFSGASGDFAGALDWICRVIEAVSHAIATQGHVAMCSADGQTLPDDSADATITDPPYYAAIPYADLSDFFYSLLKRSVGDVFPELFGTPLTPKEDDLVQLSHRAAMYRHKDAAWFEKRMQQACSDARRVTKPSGIGLFVFANKETAGWEAMLAALISAGWTITASWPIDTERNVRMRAKNSAALGSSIHLLCRPREAAGTGEGQTGDWRDILNALPTRIHEWMPRLASEGVVGADAIFACLGPALEIFSRYSRVEKADGTAIPLKDYLEHVWAAVSKEALTMIFAGADATGFEPDARLTAMWLWTLSTDTGSNGLSEDEKTEGEADDDEGGGKAVKGTGFVLEYDAARKIAQGLGAHLEQLQGVVEVKGDKATLLPVSARAQHLFGKEEGKAPAKKGKKAKQRGLFDEDGGEGGSGAWGELNVLEQGQTALDRIHQSMILFAAGRSDALKRFIVEEGVGQDQRFWRLAQALSALYPAGTEEKRWVDGVLARKKGLGF